MNSPRPQSNGIIGDHLCVRYHPRRPLVLDDVSLHIPPDKVTAFIGPNGSGKSTLLKTLARQLPPEKGTVTIDGRNIASLTPRQLAQRLGILFQENIAPADLTVEGLAYHGRYPHRRLFEALKPEDRTAVEEALNLTGIASLRQHKLSHLSSGQKQLAWVAMLLAQEPDYLFLDEPTTFLDLSHQFDVMDCLCRLNRQAGKTIVLVVHDLNLAARYADHIFALRDGRIVAAGSPADVLTPGTLRQVFDVETQIVSDDEHHLRFCMPVGKTTSTSSTAS